MKKKPKVKILVIFGLIWSVIFIIIATLPLIKGRSFDFDSLLSQKINVAELLVSVLLFLASITYPKTLSLFYKSWIKIGELLGRIISKIILVCLFFTVIIPISLLRRLFCQNLFKNKKNKIMNSYWINRDHQPQSLKKQF